MKNRRRSSAYRRYRVRYTRSVTGQRMFVICRGYRDALRIQKQFGGKVIG